MSFVERWFIWCPLLGESFNRGSTVLCICLYEALGTCRGQINGLTCRGQDLGVKLCESTCNDDVGANMQELHVGVNMQ